MNKNAARNKKTEENKPNYKFLITFICVFLAAILVFGACMGIALAVKNANAAISFDGLTMDKKTASFFVSYYKYRYMSDLSRSVENVEDTKGFWNKKIAEGANLTYGDALISSTEEYIRGILVANYLFDSYANLSSSEKKKIETAVDELVLYRADGNRDSFNSYVNRYGFDYSSLKEAAKMLYKASAVKNVIYGPDGANMQNFPDLCDEYLSEYTHVKLLFIRTETEFALDENGNRIMGDDGKDVTVALSDEKKAERAALISKINGYISGAQTGADVQMGEEMFNYYLKNNDDGDADMHVDGYYFHKNSSYTAEFYSEFSNVVDKAFEMKLDSFDSVDVDFGVCFIYKYLPTENAYSSLASEECFTDFYSDAAKVSFSKSLEELSPGVELNEKYSEIDVISTPYNYEYVPLF